MRQIKKPFKFYLIIFIFSVVLVLGYSIYMMFFKDATVNDVYVLWFMPFIFTGFYYGSDVLMDRFNKRKRKIDYEAEFLDKISQIMRDSNEFLIEEFRRLQINKNFQESLKKAYYIYENGENETYNINRLEKKYRKGSLEKRAMEYVINYLKENKKDNIGD